MKAIYYPAIFHPEGVGYSVVIPDIEGCCTQGDSMDEAVGMAQEAIGLMLEDCEVIPAASDAAQIHTEEGDFVVVIPFDLAAYRRRHDTKAVKKTLSIPSWLNQEAEAAHINFSGVLQEALKRKLNLG